MGTSSAKGRFVKVKNLNVYSGIVKWVFAAVAITAITACAAPKPTLAPGEEAVFKMRESSEGLIPLTGSEIEGLFKGRSFKTVSGNRTWAFGDNGIIDIRATDGSWEILGEEWKLDGDLLCHSLGESYFPCVPVYAVDGVYRFGTIGSDKLEPWGMIPRAQR